MTKKKTEKKTEAEEQSSVIISPPDFAIASLLIKGTAPYVQNKFSQKALNQIKADQERGKSAKKRERKAKDFQAIYAGAQHVAEGDWLGIPAPAFRNAAISVCRICGYAMTKAKLSIFIEADGVDREDGMPLVKITKGEPRYIEHYVRNETGVVDLRARPMWQPGWESIVRIRFDLGQFSLDDITNLLIRVGTQVGVGEGRPDSKKSCGMGWGLFDVVSILGMQKVVFPRMGQAG